jgi:two-component sensor histidine kinase/PAS domain-containing protein
MGNLLPFQVLIPQPEISGNSPGLAAFSTTRGSKEARRANKAKGLKDFLSFMTLSENVTAFVATPKEIDLAFLQGGGELGARIRGYDWSATPLGAPSAWPGSLKTCVRIMLTSRQPMFVWWGEEMINLYNDAYKAIVGGKHPAALGQPASEVWRDIWDEAGPRARSALHRAEGTYDEALQLIMERNGYKEETYYTFSYSPVPNDDGTTGGILCANTDETQRIVGERRLSLLRELATRTWDANTVSEAFTLSAECLGSNPRDVPFALIYAIDEKNGMATLAGRCGIDEAHTAAPQTLSFDDTSSWPIAQCAKYAVPVLMRDLVERFGALPEGAWDIPPTQAAILPIASQGHSGVAGVLVVGCNPYRPYDDSYQGFLTLIARQIAATVTNTHAYEEEVKRAEALWELDRARSEFSETLREHAATLETLNRVGQSLASDLDLERVVQFATDAATKLSGAEFGAFFYNVTNEKGEAYTLYALSGAPREAFSKFPMPRNTAIFDPTFKGTSVVRSDDITKDPRYGKSAPHFGMPKGHLPVTSYLAMPVIARTGEVIGGMFFGHKEAGIFDDRVETLVAGIAAQSAVAIDNARLFQSARNELALRREIEAHQKLLLDELNHRVKNTLATVQAIAMQTLRGEDPAHRDAFLARLFALSGQHDLLTQDNWESASLVSVVRRALRPYEEQQGTRCNIQGPEIRLAPKRALALGMAFHELATNAAKHGALSTGSGEVKVSWTVEPETGRLKLRWEEAGGPQVEIPKRRGFGTKLIERGLSHELSADVRLHFPPEGVICEWEMSSLTE